jgi:hypothetical protein
VRDINLRRLRRIGADAHSPEEGQNPILAVRLDQPVAQNELLMALPPGLSDRTQSMARRTVRVR